MKHLGQHKGIRMLRFRHKRTNLCGHLHLRRGIYYTYPYNIKNWKVARRNNAETTRRSFSADKSDKLAYIDGDYGRCGFYLAQVNVAIGVAPEDSDQMQPFFQRLEAVNKLARRAEGFVAMLSDIEDGSVSSGGGGCEYFPEGYYVNISLWRDVESFKKFTYTGAHAFVLKRKSEWFVEWDEDLYGPKQCMWWVPKKVRGENGEEDTFGIFSMPSPREAADRLQSLRENGPSQDAFTLSHLYPPPSQ